MHSGCLLLVFFTSSPFANGRDCKSAPLEHTFNISSDASCCGRYSSRILKSAVTGAPFTLQNSYLTLALDTKPDYEMPTFAYLIENNMTLHTRYYYLSWNAEEVLRSNGYAPTSFEMSSGSGSDSGSYSELGSGSGEFPSVSAAEGSESWCRDFAHISSRSFDSKASFSGAPAGCTLHNDGRVIYVFDCSNHVNCNTLVCNNCTVLAIPAALYNYIHISYSKYPADYPYWLNLDKVYVRRQFIGRIYVDICAPPPHSPPPPTVKALCLEGTWPLFSDNSHSNSLSPSNTSHNHTFSKIVYFMPDGFEGATHDKPGSSCPNHALKLSPPPSAPPSAPHPLNSLPPYRLPKVVSASLIFLLSAATVGLLSTCFLTRYLNLSHDLTGVTLGCYREVK